jgi:DNA-binding winged helix-turn-helix (wHTH) protein/Tol biopolymer transport system component
MFAFGTFQFDPAERQLIRDGVKVRLTPKAADLLEVLLESGGQVVPKEALIQRLWPSTFVEDGNLAFHIHQIRHALGDSADHPQYIETIPKRGYRFVWPVERPPNQDRPKLPAPAPAQDPPIGAPPIDAPRIEAPPASSPTVFPAQERRWGRAAAVTVGLLGISAAALAFSFRHPPLPRVTRITQLTDDGKSKSYLTALDATRFLVATPSGQRVFRTDLGSFEADNPLDQYVVLDVSQVRGEALAFRPSDRGAEFALWAVRLDGTRPRRIGMVQTQVAAWSHDGERIGYADTHSVYVTDAVGGVMKNVATFTGEVGWLRWAEDDRTIRVSVGDSSNRTVVEYLYDIDPSGAARALKVHAPAAPRNNGGAWMPGSSDYVFVSGGETNSDIWLLREWRLPFRRTKPELRQLTPVGTRVQYGNPIPSPDGKRIYVTAAAVPQLSVYDEARRQFVPYLDGIPAFAVWFSRDRKSVVYINHHDLTLWHARADGSDRRQLTFPPWYVDGVAWSPDGRQLAIRAKAPGHQQTKVHLLSPDGGTPKALEPRDIEQGIPSWSPDGSRIAFGDVPEDHGRPTGSERISIWDLRTGQTTVLQESEGIWSPRWSPDGRYMAATRIVDRAVMLFTFATRRWREFPVKRCDDLLWTADSQYLYCDPEQHREVHRIRVADGDVEPIVNLAEEGIAHTGAGVSLDGRLLFLRTATDIFALELERR